MARKKSAPAKSGSGAAKGSGGRKAGRAAGKRKRSLPAERTHADGGPPDAGRVTEQALRESEQKYRALVEQSLQGLLVIEGLRIVFANPAFAEISGYTVEELVSLSPEQVTALVHPDDQALVWKRFEDRLAGKPVPARYEYRLIRKDGSERWLEMFASRVGYGGKPAIQGAVVDLTDRKRAEEQVLVANERLQRLMASTTACVYSSNPSSDYGATFIAGNVTGITGHQPSQLIDDPRFWIDHVHPDDKERILSEVHRAFEVDRLDRHAYEYRFRRSDGTYIWMRDEMRLVCDAEGNPLEIVGYWVDITERKQAEQELRLHSEIAANLSEGVCLVRDADGVVVFANPRFEEMFGYGPGEMTGKHVSFVNAPTEKSPEETAKEIMGALDKTGVWQGEVRNIKKDGTQFWCYATISSFDHHAYGKVQVSVSIDITERKQAEDALRAQRDLGVRLGAVSSLEQAFPICLQAAIDASHMDCGGISLVDKDGGVHLAATKGGSANFANKVAHFDADSQPARFVAAGTPVYARSDELPPPVRDASRQEGFQVEAVVPVCHEGKPVACLNVASRRLDEIPLSARNALEAIAAQIGSALVRIKAQDSLDASNRFLRIANRHTEMQPLLEEFVAEVRQLVGCDAVGIRVLDEEGNIPYRAYQGFSREFYDLESPLAIESDQCMCINVVMGQTDPSLPFYTPGGSFYMNGTTRFLATVSEEDKGKTRNACNAFGYESVALVPIHFEERILGLIHLADPQENMVPLGSVKLVETVATQLGGAIQRVRAKEALRAEKEFTDTALDAQTDTLFVFDPSTGQAIRWNETFAEVSGYTDEEIRSMRAPDSYYSQADLELAAAAVEKVLTEGAATVEVSLITKDGRSIPTEYTGSVITDGEGNPKYIIAVGRDITERKQMESAVRESEEKFRTLAEQSPNMIFINQKGRVVYANRRCERVMGYAREEFYVPDFDFLCLIAPEYVEQVKSNLRKHLNGEEVDTYECALVTREGRRIEAILSTKNIEYSGRSAILGTVTDITDRKAAEEKLRRMEAQLAHVGRLSTMGELVGGIAHEVSQPLYSVLNFAKASRNVLTGESEPNLDDLRDWSEQIAAAASRAGQIIARLRSFVRRTELQRSPADINEVIEESVELVAFETRRDQVAVQLALGEKLPVVHVDRVQIQQVLVNLLRNACEALDQIPAGRRRVIVRTSQPGEAVEVSVSDNGPGLPPEEDLNLFDAFATSKPGGLGIGLAISRTIIEAHGGDLWADPTPNGGATFHFTLPIARGGPSGGTRTGRIRRG